MKTPVDFRQPKARHKELGQYNLEEVLPRARHVHESGFPDSDPSDVFANPATQSQFGILHCPPLTSRNSTMQSLTSKVGDGSESCLAQSNLSRFSSLMTRTDNGSGRARTGTATPADLRPPKDRGPFLFVFPASRRTDPRVHCPHLKSRNSTMCPLKNKVCGGSEPVLAQRNPSRFSLSTTRADNGSARPRTGTEIPADLRQPKDRGPFLSVLPALRRPDPRPLPPLAIKEWYDVPSTNYGVRWLCTVLVPRTLGAFLSQSGEDLLRGVITLISSTWPI